jgi:hypothetical protein
MNLHIFAESGAIGDQALNLCRINAALVKGGYQKAIIHTSSILHANGIDIPINPDVLKIWERTKFIKEVIIDNNCGSPKEDFKIQEPMDFLEINDIREWVDLKDFIPDFTGEKIALFQPISLKLKPKDHINDYIPVWNLCLKTLIRKGYEIFMVGSENDPIDLCVDKEFLPYINNKCGKWSVLESIAFTIYCSDFVLSCDSWAGLWGIASQKKTAIAWGHRMENNIDFWVSNFLGNKNYYKYGWSSQKDYCDAFLAEYIESL